MLTASLLWTVLERSSCPFVFPEVFITVCLTTSHKRIAMHVHAILAPIDCVLPCQQYSMLILERVPRPVDALPSSLPLYLVGWPSTSATLPPGTSSVIVRIADYEPDEVIIVHSRCAGNRGGSARLRVTCYSTVYFSWILPTLMPTLRQAWQKHRLRIFSVRHVLLESLSTNRYV